LAGACAGAAVGVLAHASHAAPSNGIPSNLTQRNLTQSDARPPKLAPLDRRL